MNESHLEHRPGFCSGSSDYGVFLASIIMYFRCRTIVEIGVAYGTTTALLAKAAENSDRWAERGGVGIVHGFDCWSTWGSSGQNIQLGSMKDAEEYIKDNNCFNVVLHQIDTKSEAFRQALLQIPQIDFAFIDGDHSYSGVKNDWNAVYPRMASSGIIALHDTMACDGCREFALEVRTSLYDGTFDVVDIPFGNRQHKAGLTLVFKRPEEFYTKQPWDLHGSQFPPEQIVAARRQWADKERSR